VSKLPLRAEVYACGGGAERLLLDSSNQIRRVRLGWQLLGGEVTTNGEEPVERHASPHRAVNSITIEHGDYVAVGFVGAQPHVRRFGLGKFGFKCKPNCLRRCAIPVAKSDELKDP
jgi:hypothetical protein